MVGVVAGAEFGDVAVHIILDRREGYGAKEVEESGGGLSSGEEARCVNALGGSIGTEEKCVWRVSNQVLPAGMVDILQRRDGCERALSFE